MKSNSSRRPVTPKAALEAIAKRPENQLCADCLVAGPRWLSINIGVFLCIDCSGLHRDLGTHVSKIKSITLDDWHHDTVEFVGSLGNKICNAYYEALLPKTHQRPPPKSPLLKDFIQRKYEYREWIPRGSVFSPADILRDTKNPTALITSKTLAQSFSPATTSPSVLLDPPLPGKTRHTSSKKSNKSKAQPMVTPSIDEKIFTPDASQQAQPKAKESPDDLLMDFWGDKDALAPPAHNTTDLLLNSPQSLGYAMEPPSFRRVQEAKTAGAKETQLQCITDPGSLCLGPPTFPSIFPSTTGAPGAANGDPWVSGQNGQDREQLLAFNQPSVAQEPEDYLASAISRNLDKLSILSSR